VEWTGRGKADRLPSVPPRAVAGAAGGFRATGRYAFAHFLRQAAIDREFRMLPPKQQTPFARTILASGRHDGACIGPVLAEWVADSAGVEQ